MGILARMAEKRQSLEQTNVSLRNPPDWVFEAFGGEKSKAGVRVSEKSLLGWSAVVAAMRVRADAVAQIPPVLYRRQGRGRVRAVEHPAYGLMHDRPNPAMARSVFMSTAETQVQLWGGFYAEIERKGNRVVALWPLPADRCTVVLNEDTGVRVCVLLQPNGERIGIPEPYFLHVPSWSLDGIMGLALRQMGRESLGVGLATQEHAARFFSNGTRPGLIVEHPATLEKKGSKDRLRESIDAWAGGASKAYRTLVLEEGAKAHDYGFDAEMSQLLESRRFGVEDVSRITRVPLHKISSLERATFSNIEQQSQEFLSDTLNPVLAIWEQVLTYELLTEKERASGLYFEFLREAILQMDAAARSALYRELFNIGAYTRDEIREKENLAPLPEEQLGDQTFIPLNMVPARLSLEMSAPNPASPAASGDGPPDGTAGDPAAEPPPGPQRSSVARHRYCAAYVPVMVRAAERVVRREVAELRRLHDKREAGFLAAAEAAYTAMPEVIRREMAPVAWSLAALVRDAVDDEVGGSPANRLEEVVSEYVGGLARRWVADARAALSGAAAAGTIGELLDRWEAGKAQTWGGLEETTRVGEFVAAACYRALGIRERQEKPS